MFDFTCFDRQSLSQNGTFFKNTKDMATVLQLSDIPSSLVTAQLRFNVTSTVSEYVNAYGRSYSVGDYLMHDCGSNTSAVEISGTTAQSSFKYFFARCFLTVSAAMHRHLVRSTSIWYANTLQMTTQSKYPITVWYVLMEHWAEIASSITLRKPAVNLYLTVRIEWPTNGTVEYQVNLLPSTINRESWVYWRFDEPSSNQLEIQFTGTPLVLHD